MKETENSAEQQETKCGQEIRTKGGKVWFISLISPQGPSIGGNPKDILCWNFFSFSPDKEAFSEICSYGSLSFNVNFIEMSLCGGEKLKF